MPSEPGWTREVPSVPGEYEVRGFGLFVPGRIVVRRSGTVLFASQTVSEEERRKLDDYAPFFCLVPEDSVTVLSDTARPALKTVLTGNEVRGPL